MGGHTPEPWLQPKLKPRKVTSQGILICTAVLRNFATTAQNKHGKGVEEAEANARRIVASVNATAGISVEALEAGYIAELVGALQQAEDALDGVPAGDLSAKIDRRIDKALKRVTATLAKVKGDAA